VVSVLCTFMVIANSVFVLAAEGASTIEELMKRKVHFHKPGENYKTDGYITTPQTKRLLEEHLKATGGRVSTSFFHNFEVPDCVRFFR
jgi:hypothetical protein